MTTLINSNSDLATEQYAATSNCDDCVYFAVPGNINNLTGGYGYDRELIKELARMDIAVRLLGLSAEFPNPTAGALAETAQIFATIPTGSVVIVDGLAFGVMDDIARAESSRLKLIALCHHPLALETGIDQNAARELILSETRALQSTRAVIVTSRMTADILAADFSVPLEKMVVALPGTSRHAINSRNNSRVEADIPILLTLATITKRKGHDLLIEALAQLRHLPWHARFVGSQEFDQEWCTYLKQRVNEENLHHRITFVGKVDEVAREFFAADIFVLPSHFEGYGMAFAEALSFGLPIIGASAGAVADVVPASAGILIPPGDIKALACALETLLTNPALRRELQIGAQEAARSLPTWSDCANEVVQLINKVKIS